MTRDTLNTLSIRRTASADFCKACLLDTGLLLHLRNIGSTEDLDMHPVRGASWIVDQDAAAEPLNARVQRRGFAIDPDWLPPA